MQVRGQGVYVMCIAACLWCCCRMHEATVAACMKQRCRWQQREGGAARSTEQVPLLH